MDLLWALNSLTLTSLIDILLVALLFFAVSFFLRGTQAVALVRGLIVLLIALLVLSSVLNLTALRWLLENMLVVLGLAIPVIFQPELRRALEQLGRARMVWARGAPDTLRDQIIEEICLAAEKLAERRHGALIVLQRSHNLQDYIRTGIRVDGTVTSQILLTIFWPKTELHDGAAIIDARGRLASAASVLPLTASRNLPDPRMGTRHRAALGITEVSDAVCVVISEESGRIAIASGGRMIARLDARRLRTILTAFYGEEQSSSPSFLGQLRMRGHRLISSARERQKQT